MIERAVASSVPFRWVAGDTVYGVGDIERKLCQAGKGYVLGVDASRVFRSWGKSRAIAGTASEIAKALRASDWERLSAGAGTKGPRLHDWCYRELADLQADEFNDEIHGLWTRSLLIRRNIADGDLAYFTTWCPAGTPRSASRVTAGRLRIEDSFETAKNDFVLGHNVIDRRDNGAEFAPGHHTLHLRQECRPTVRLAVLVEAGCRQGQLPHLYQLQYAS